MTSFLDIKQILGSRPYNDDEIYINGQWAQSASKTKTQVVDPATAEAICEVPECNAEDVDVAVRAASHAFHYGPWTNEYSGADRRDAILRVAEAIEEKRHDLALLESLNTGKPLTDAEGEMDETVAIFKYFAGFADKIEGRHVAAHVDQGLEGYTVKMPVGVVGFINAFNYPLSLLAWKVAPALAAGCTIVFKPGPQTPITTQYFAALLDKTGKFPPGVFNVVLGGAEAGQALVDHNLVDKVGFTGSVATGKQVIKSTASSHMVRPVSVELGGKSPGVVMPDIEDMEKTARLVLSGCMSNAGMNCNALTRLWVHKSIYDQFLSKLKAAAEELDLGHPWDKKTQMGPLIDKRQYGRVMDYIRIGKEEDKAEVLTGGESCNKGYRIQPTIFANVNPKARIATEEIFGPVLSVLAPFESLEEVIDIERHSEYGLAAGIFTSSHKSVALFTRKMRNGTIWVNSYNGLCPYLPFGGFRNSGYGRELGAESLDGYLVPKAIIDDVTF